LVCLVSSGLLAFVYQATSKQIEINREVEKNRKIKAVLGAETDEIKELEQEGFKYYRGYHNGEFVGTVLESESNGYGGPIKLLVAVDKDGGIMDISVLSHKETPGLGSQIERPKFLGQFRGVSLDILTGKHAAANESGTNGIDTITAATISSNAVIKAAGSALEKFNEVKDAR